MSFSSWVVGEVRSSRTQKGAREGGGQGAPCPSGEWMVAEKAGARGLSAVRAVWGRPAGPREGLAGSAGWARSASTSVFHKLRELG